MVFNIAKSLIFLTCILGALHVTTAFPDQGIWKFHVNNWNSSYFTVNHKSLYNGSVISVKLTCDSAQRLEIGVSWKLHRTSCFQAFLYSEELSQEQLRGFFESPNSEQESKILHESKEEIHECVHDFSLKHVQLGEEVMEPETRIILPEQRRRRDVTSQAPVTDSVALLAQDSALTQVRRDGIYLLIIKFRPINTSVPFNLTVDVSMKGDYGYLSAVEWPYLPFYATMCVIYTAYALGWLTVSFMKWRELLRIQFWIGAVIFLGLLEKATFYAEYESINSTGHSVKGAILFAEFVSCLKRSLARLLVIIVSLGFGIVKPRLGDMLQRVVVVGGLYFMLALGEGCIRELRPRTTPDRTMFSISMALALLDSAICWWIFSSLVQTTRTLTLRRNIVKLTLYRHFTNTLIFSVLASAVFLVWVILNHRMSDCITDWKEIWFDDAYWQVLFSVILLVIMVLWRPTNNNNRFAFTPLLDAADDEMDAENSDTATLLDVTSIKQRQIGSKGNQPPAQVKEVPPSGSIEEDLKWIEAHVPTDAALGKLVDSEEEILTVQFERNKME